MKPYWTAIFGLIAVAVGLAVSYFPPRSNADAIFTLVGAFLGQGIRELFVHMGSASAPKDQP